MIAVDRTSVPQALVTGATGFIGTRLVRLLFERGWGVHAVVRPTSSSALLPSNLILHVDDGSPASLGRIVSHARPTACFHLAGMFVASHRPGEVAGLVDDNVGFGARLAEALAAQPGTLLINTGTYWQHVEGSPYRPAALYAATKQAFEDIARYYTDSQLLRVISLKLFDTYGPFDPRMKLLNLFLSAALTGESLDTSGGEQLVDLVHVDDVAAALLAAAEEVVLTSETAFRSFSVSSGAPISVRGLAAEVEAVTGRRISARWGRLPYRQNEMFSPWDAGPRLPAWTPKIGLREGITAAWQALRHYEEM